jgi:dolichol-phosphate mannosyltransferase
MTAVVLPVYNEAATIGMVLDSVRQYFDDDVIVIDDGSEDGTSMLLTARSDVNVVRLDHNCGYGCALRIGFDLARDMGHGKIVTMDCDGQHEPHHIPEFLAALDGDVDIVSGSRYLPSSGGVGAVPPGRREINERITRVVNEATGFRLTDSFCGFKAYRGSALAQLKLSEPGYAMPLELWAQAWKAGLRISELPVERIYCDHDRSFGHELDDEARRYAYYESVWNRALGEA